MQPLCDVEEIRYISPEEVYVHICISSEIKTILYYRKLVFL